MQDIKRVILMVLPLLFVPLVYGLSSTPDVCAAPKDPRFDSSEAVCTNSPETLSATCCWVENTEPGNPKPITRVCQTCYIDTGTGEFFTCDPPARPLPQLEQVPTTPPPLFGFGQNLPQDLPTLEQAPPRFGQNLPQDLPTLEETPPSPLPPPPAGPTILPEDGEVLEQPDVEEQDEPSAAEPEQPSVD